MTKSKVNDLKVRAFAELIANMKTEEETRGGFTREDAIAEMDSLIESARAVTGIDPNHMLVYCAICDKGIEDCDCDRCSGCGCTRRTEECDCGPGQCLTCGTQCENEGICPTCARLEQAGERVREATAAAAQAGLRGEVPAATQKALRAAYRAYDKAKNVPLESCRKCGGKVTLFDLKEHNACIDLGEGEEEGKVFVYCSEHCRDAH